jgi:hypothetical protein
MTGPGRCLPARAICTKHYLIRPAPVGALNATPLREGRPLTDLRLQCGTSVTFLVQPMFCYRKKKFITVEL